MPRSANSAAAVGLAKRMKRKRQQALLFGGMLLTGAVGGLVLLAVYLNQPKPQPSGPIAQVTKTPPKSQLPTVAVPGEGNNLANNPLNDPGAPQAASMGSDLIQPGENNKPMELQATPMPKPDAMATPGTMPNSMVAEPNKPMVPVEPTKPAEPTKPEPTKPEPTKPEPTKPEPTKPEPTKPEPEKAATKPEAKPADPPDAKLTSKERRAWQEDMKRAQDGLSKLDPAASEKELEELATRAKTAAQRTQVATLQQVLGLVRKARESLVAGIDGLEGAQTFRVANTEVAFVEGDETRLIIRMSGSRREFKLDAIPTAMALELMKMKPNVVDTKLDAAMGAYIMVQPKKTSKLSDFGKQLLDGAAALGAISPEVSQFYAEDYKVQ